MEVEQSRLAYEEIAQSITTTENNQGTQQQLVHVDSEQMIDNNFQSPNFRNNDESIFHREVLPAGFSSRKRQPQTSPMNVGGNSLDSDNRNLLNQIENVKPKIMKNAKSNQISPNNKQNINVNNAEEM